MQVLGCDFSSSPGRHKPVVLAIGELHGHRVRLQSLEFFETLAQWGAWLSCPGDWIGGFDLPFGLPRELVEHLGWPTDWAACMDHFAGLERSEVRDRFAAFCNTRPAGGKFAHRATDRPAGSSPSMKWINPPVAFMMHAGVPWLRRAGVHLPGLAEGDRSRVALEAYPGLLAREVLGHQSYKSDDKARQTPQRLMARRQLLGVLERGQHRLGLRLVASHALMNRLADDPRGDALDATLCMLQAAWALSRHQAGHPQFGLPKCDPLEGWIVTA